MISIIIPAYNAEMYLEKCVNSILNNNIRDFELIIIDDGSTDNTSTICKSIAKMDSRVRFYSKKNGGVSSARNYGIKKAKGELLIFIDADDFIDKCFLQELLTGIGNADFLCAGFSIFESEHQSQIFRYTNVKFDGSLREYADRLQEWLNPPYLLSPWSKVFRKEIIDKYDLRFCEDMSYGEDVVFVFDYLLKVTSVKCIESSGYYYRKSVNSLSKGYRPEILHSDMIGLKRIENFLVKNKSVNEHKIMCGRFVDVYSLFIKRLIKSRISYRVKKKTFLESINQYHPIDYFKDSHERSIGFDLIFLVLKFPRLFFLLGVFNIR